MKKYLQRGGIVGLAVTAVVLAIVELSTVCSGLCSGSRLPEKAFLADALMIYGLFLLVGTVVGIFLGWVVAKFKSNKN